MKPYLKLDYEYTEAISSGIYNFVKNKTEILERDLRYWQFLDTQALLSHVPELTKYFSKNRLLVRDAAITVLYEDLKLHVDPLPVLAKINFPVLNTQGWVNRWYNIPFDSLQDCEIVETSFGHHTEKVITMLPELLTLAGEIFDMSEPMVFHSRLPHEVIKLTPATLPRIIASFTFHNEPIHLLK